MKNKLLKILGLSVGIGIMLSIVSIAFNWDSSVVSYYYWRVGIGAVVLVAAGYSVYYIYKMKQLKPVMELFEERKYDEFIHEMKEHLEDTENRELQSMMMLNMGAAYVEQEAYEKAIELYSDIDPKNLNSKQLKLVYALNMMIANFKLGEYEKFDQYYISYEDLLKHYEENKNYAEPIGQVEIYHEILRDDLDLASERLDKLRANSKSPRYQGEYSKIEKLIEDKRDDIDA